MSLVLLRANTQTLWEEGAAYIGWIFYMSKFYEFVDTIVILARGKKSSLLQTYHHAGVIICGWASLRYESPAYLVGIVLNSGIHTLMYSYFTVQSFGVSIPMSIKRSLTRLQIAQFVTGFFWGYGYLFVKYNEPSDTMNGTIVNIVAAGSHIPIEQNVSPVVGSALGHSGREVSCLSDSGEAFTILLTTVYVFPLLLLFVRFFSDSYGKKNNKG
ncbi:hypothetical protein N7495_007363 [Penicillium taxi]|uniref:uncharacterized protein n=1 Tax=Penicillium taxi TaxID=168475 RepID=UPI002545107E|nr:uncharacterized protein N7495_007363 [Penicillium taxi]KAJ5895672.1 hypothetical protein N7495_007363 [Penicillium taxi]